MTTILAAVAAFTAAFTWWALWEERHAAEPTTIDEHYHTLKPVLADQLVEWRRDDDSELVREIEQWLREGAK